MATNSRTLAETWNANSGVLVLPTMMSPARLRRRVSSLSVSGV